MQCSAVSNSLRLRGLEPTWLLCPWTFLGKNTGVGFHFLHQGIFLTEGSNSHLLCLLYWHADSLSLNHLGISQTPSIAVVEESFQGKGQKPWPILIWPGRNMQADFERLSSKLAKTVWKPGCEAMWSRRERGTPKIDWTCFSAIMCLHNSHPH